MISIVTGYYNRKELFQRTLHSISNSKYKDIEVIAVDDGSDDEHRLEDLSSSYPFLKIIRLEKINKWYINPCVTFNFGLRLAKGDIIVMQNPECLHIHDVLRYVNENVNDTNYISMSTYGLDPNTTSKLPEHIKNDTLEELLREQPQRPYTGGDASGWYNHSQFRPVHFHFCAAISRKNMSKLNGFDERFAMGIGYDDDEIIHRIRVLGLNLVIEDEICVFHQHHPSVWFRPNERQLSERNRIILQTKTHQEGRYKANISNQLWGGI